ncbi:MAG: hypothetical protein RL417_947 [Pseudomonadota bacterium]|jgi:hypothetical protein
MLSHRLGSLAVVLVSLLLPATLLASPAPVSEGNFRIAPDSGNQIVKFTDTGIEPPILRANRADSIVFFLNSTTDSLTTIEIDYGEKRMHCASSALELGDDGKIRSVRPFGPRTFTSACFPDRGEYKVRVFGLKEAPSGISSSIVVE